MIDKLENLCISRALAAFHLSADAWGVSESALRFDAMALQVSD